MVEPRAQGITALILAGGQGRRMGGVDKGLQTLHGQSFVQHALQRLRAQTCPPTQILINANRHPEHYAALGLPLCADRVAGFAGPLAGVLAGLDACDTPWMLTVPCDTPHFPLDLIERMHAALLREQVPLAVAMAADEQGQSRLQPVFCLLQRTLQPALQAFVDSGQRRVASWLQSQPGVTVAFDRPGDDPRAFFNINTLTELQQLEQTGVFSA